MYVETWQLVFVGIAAVVAALMIGATAYAVGKDVGVRQFCKKYFNISRVYLEPNGLTLELDIRRASVFTIRPADYPSSDAKHQRAIENARNLLEAVTVG